MQASSDNTDHMKWSDYWEIHIKYKKKIFNDFLDWSLMESEYIILK